MVKRERLSKPKKGCRHQNLNDTENGNSTAVYTGSLVKTHTFLSPELC